MPTVSYGDRLALALVLTLPRFEQKPGFDNLRSIDLFQEQTPVDEAGCVDNELNRLITEARGHWSNQQVSLEAQEKPTE